MVEVSNQGIPQDYSQKPGEPAKPRIAKGQVAGTASNVGSAVSGVMPGVSGNATSMQQVSSSKLGPARDDFKENLVNNAIGSVKSNIAVHKEPVITQYGVRLLKSNNEILKNLLDKDNLHPKAIAGGKKGAENLINFLNNKKDELKKINTSIKEINNQTFSDKKVKLDFLSALKETKGLLEKLIKASEKILENPKPR